MKKRLDRDFEEVHPGKRRVHGAWIWIVLILILADAAAMWFVAEENYYRYHFQQGTTLNGRDVSGKTAEAVKQEISQELSDYTLIIRERTKEGGSDTEAVGGSEIGLEMVFDDSLEQALREQTGGNWLRRRGGQTALTVDTLLQYDEAALGLRTRGLHCFSEDFIQKPRDASLSEYVSGVGYEIVPEVVGNQPNQEVIEKALKTAIQRLVPELNLDQVENAYVQPKVTADDADLNELAEKMNFYANVRITYQFGDQTEVLDGDQIHNWIVIGENNQVTLDPSGADDFVVYLRKKYDTIFRPRTFQTSYGEEISFEAEDGDYGWWMNYVQEQQELKAMLQAGISGERTPVYYQTAASYGEHDYGDTYVEVNVTAQHVFFYQDGILRMETDCVSGNASRGNDTPAGVYGITYKERNATLEGENYSSPVSWWMPFNGNVGLHDATWRYEFGEDLYLSSGSHGCVNLPYAFAKELYSMVSAGTPVIVYRLEGTESDSITTQDEYDLAQAAVDAIDYIGEIQKTEDCEKRITRARDLYDDLSGEAKSYVTNYEDLKEAEEAYSDL